jgi:hypothetical protein
VRVTKMEKRTASVRAESNLPSQNWRRHLISAISGISIHAKIL